MKITLDAYAKLNLALDVKGIRPDNYHNIESVFQSVSLCDTITVSANEDRITVLCDEELPQNNTCTKAAKAFFMTAGIEGGVDIEIKKGIPLLSGLGGGSADAAAVLRAMNFIFAEPLCEEQLIAIAKKIGADVPFCLYGGTMKVEGIGEKLKSVAPLEDCGIIIIKDLIKPSTASLYKSLDESEIPLHPDIDGLIECLKENKIKETAKKLGNVFEYAWDTRIEKIKSDLIAAGAYGASLSGSGPSVFGIFSEENAMRAYNSIKNHYKEVYLCYPKKHGYSIKTIE